MPLKNKKTIMKRKFEDLRNKILKTLSDKPLTRMEIAKKIDADYRTVDKHLIWLCGVERIRKINRDKKIYYRLA